MTRSEWLIQAVLSLNSGNTGYAENRVKFALQQYEQLVKAGVKFDTEKEEN